MASITFNDGSAGTVQSGLPAPANRFRGWEPFVNPIGDSEHALGTGVLHHFAFRDDYGARFTVPYIPRADQAVVLRLIRHLRRGGTCTVTTGDSLSSTYATCGLAPDAEPEFRMSDPVMIEFELTLSLINLAASPVAMVCQY